jgi:hypothetical protein
MKLWRIWPELPWDLQIRIVVFTILFCGLIYLGASYPLGDGGPLPMCPPCHPGGSKNCGPYCDLTKMGPQLPVPLADGSDPMPLCRHKGCGPFKVQESSN